MKYFGLIAVCCLFLGCNKIEIKNEFVNVEEDRIINKDGNQIILHGINYVNKGAKIDTLNFSNPENFKLMQKWGLNCVRLGVIWAGVEPDPGIYDEAYLKDLDYQIELASNNGMYVFLDMHQDLYSQLYSDGAPEWATLNENQPHVSISPVWSDAYFTSPAVKTSITNFWNNKSASDGIGIQDRYVDMWKMLAKRYAGNTTVIGFDLMNEPNIGWGNIKGQELMIAAFIESYAKETGIVYSGEEVVFKWMSTEGRAEILSFLSDPVIYENVVDAMYPVYSVFEEDQLMPFFEKTTKAIREVNKNHILFLETSMSSNMGVRTAISRIEDEEKLIYAPHGYDLVVDTQDYTATNNERVNFIFNRHLESAELLKMPLVIGEWGAFSSNGDALNSAFQVTKFFEKSMCGETYWTFTKELDNSKLLKAVSRAYPKIITGKLISYSTDVENGMASFEWDEKNRGTNEIFIPSFYNLTKDDIKLSPIGNGFKLNKTDGGWNIYITSIFKRRVLSIKKGSKS